MNQLTLELQPSGAEYRTIPLTRGQVAIVDAEDYERLSKYRWRAMWSALGKSWYACRGNNPMVHMHRDVIGHNGFVDHRNHNTLDNRKGNLRPATRAQNAWNRGKLSTNKSGFKGVHWCKSSKAWRAKIEANGVIRRLGPFRTAEEAAVAYHAAAKELHGEFANW